MASPILSDDAKWWRVKIVNGVIVDCLPVETISGNGSSVFYVPAVNREQAITEAEKLLATHERAKSRARRLQNKAMGLCACGRERESGMNMCTACLKTAAAARERTKLRKNGIDVVVDRGESMRKSRMQTEKNVANSARVAAFIEVRDAWASAKNTLEFAQWLATELKGMGIDK